MDVVVLAERLPDLTAQQVISEIRSSSRLAGAPILILSEDAEGAEGIYGESTQGILSGPDAAAVTEAMSERLNADRERADQLSAQAAKLLATLAGAGAPVGNVADKLAATLVGRPDGVVVSSSEALGATGGASPVCALVTVLGAEQRSDEARAAAGFAAAQIIQRTGAEADAAALLEVARSDAALNVRKAATAALGSLDLDPLRRAELLGSGASPQ
jgi:hypothetical protein